MSVGPFEFDHRKEVTVEELQQHGYENTGAMFSTLEIWGHKNSRVLLKKVQEETRFRVVSVYSV